MRVLHLLPFSTFGLLAMSAPAPDTSTDLPRTANTVMIKNSCDYDLNLAKVPGGSQVTPAVEKLPAHGSWSVDFVADTPGGSGFDTSVKIALGDQKPEGNLSITQFEYNYITATNQVWYDISLVDCTRNVSKDEGGGTHCPGWESGLRVQSGKACVAYECAAQEFCPKQVYWFNNYDGKTGAPNTACDVKEGVTFELCTEKSSGT
ncbi:hypothetical protein K491DRAFT_713119 [Lophiostoma macrostomum CBS 122681]|uniref:Osmotin, thaumatin-like protein n=1 Tax=Lophiostoma macrostomum CBS 122681 TaxID=1314788 RepID=A0A6A6THE3_9PLEO|nr:hypothetical protein K491DRAFT_713119 [Lophiostoma macrostomum CBS 122681]